VVRWLSKFESRLRPPLWVTLATCGVILVARRPDAWRSPQFWAEDGTVFFAQAWTFGARAIALPYAGYLHVLPRLIAWGAVQFDPLRAPLLFHLGAAGLTLYVAARTQSPRMPFERHAGFALAVVLVPDAFEVLLFLSNVQWVLAGGLLLLLLSRDAARPRERVHDALAAVLLGLTGPFSVALAPLFAWRAVQRRTRASVTLAALVLATAAAQTWLIVRTPGAASDKTVATEALLAVPGMRVGASLFVGQFVPPDYPLGAETALGVGLLALVALLAARRGAGRIERVWLACGFLALLASALYRCRFVLLDLRHATFGARYFFPLQLTFIWLVLATTMEPRRWLARMAIVAAIWMLAINVGRLREPALSDLHWPQTAAPLRRGAAAEIPINPPGWSFSIPARPD
jgi:hypothetical protein